MKPQYSYIEYLKFEQQLDCAYAAAELIFMLAEKDCLKAQSYYEQWLKTDSAKNPVLQNLICNFAGSLGEALSAIATREGQTLKLYTPCDLLDDMDKAMEVK